jgi:hypothetical protein
MGTPSFVSSACLSGEREAMSGLYHQAGVGRSLRLFQKRMFAVQ